MSEGFPEAIHHSGGSQKEQTACLLLRALAAKHSGAMERPYLCVLYLANVDFGQR